jgi:uncharacterized protein (TIGR00297 family)
VAHKAIDWQSKLILLAVLPFAGTEVALNWQTWAPQHLSIALWTVGLSALLGLVTWIVRAATPIAAVTGAVITASLMFSTANLPYQPWHTALIPALAVSLLAYAATQAGRGKKERMGTAEGRRGRSSTQIAANLGVAALVASGPVQEWLIDCSWMKSPFELPAPLYTLALAALAEAAADTVSSEIGQAFGGRPWLMTTWRRGEPGQNGAVSPIGTLAGVLAAALVAAVGTWAVEGSLNLFWISGAGGVLGLVFDSLLGATVEDPGWLNNDAVNFLSTGAAAGFALAMLLAWH